MQFITIQDRYIPFEDGLPKYVSAFQITPNAISMAEFKAFVDATGHVTTAEEEGHAESFATHFGLEELTAAEILRHPATLVSYVDAQAFCRWSGTVLPTEEQVLAAALVDTDLHEQLDKGLRAKFRQFMLEERIIHSDSKITGTLCGSETFVVRRGPFPYLTKGWQTRLNRNRILKHLRHYDLVLEFHVCPSPRVAHGT
jgi:hypothetical protein